MFCLLQILALVPFYFPHGFVCVLACFPSSSQKQGSRQNNINSSVSHVYEIENVASCSAFTPTGVTGPGACTTCKGSRAWADVLEPKATPSGMSAIATWVIPLGILPIYSTVLLRLKRAPGFHVVVGHQEFAGKSILAYCSLPVLSSSSTTIRNGGIQPPICGHLHIAGQHVCWKLVGSSKVIANQAHISSRVVGRCEIYLQRILDLLL